MRSDCRRRLNTGPPAPVYIWATGAVVGVPSGRARDLGSIIDRVRRKGVAWRGAVGGDQADEARRGSLAAGDPAPDGRPPRHDPSRAGLAAAAALRPAATSRVEA